MPLVTDPTETRGLIRIFQERRVTLPCFCTENVWTTEAILRAALEAGRKFGLAHPTVCVGFTASYPPRSNISNYLACADPALGLQAVLKDLELLVAPGSPYESCRVLPALDHGQPDADRAWLEDEADRFAIVMFDASALPFEENVGRTAAYVRRMRDRVVTEGAADELKEAASAGDAFNLTTAAQARRFVSETGCDLIVANVGTEHRAAAAGRGRYARERVREIAAAVGPRLVIHGTSCLGDADLSTLPHDGVLKVNVWTIIERKGAEAVARWVMENLGHAVRPEVIRQMVADGLLGRAFSDGALSERLGEAVGPRLDTFPLVNLRRRWVETVSRELVRYFEMFGHARLAE